MTITDIKPGVYAIHFLIKREWVWCYSVHVRVDIDKADFDPPPIADGIRVLPVEAELARKHGEVEDLPPKSMGLW